MKRVGQAVSAGWRWLVRISPVVLAGVSAYYMFFVIAPFFLLGISHVPLRVLRGDTISYDSAMGNVSTFAAFVLVMFGLGAKVTTVSWLLSFANFCGTRNKWVLLLLLLAFLPVVYVDSGPYAEHINEWIWGD